MRRQKSTAPRLPSPSHRNKVGPPCRDHETVNPCDARSQEGAVRQVAFENVKRRGHCQGASQLRQRQRVVKERGVQNGPDNGHVQQIGLRAYGEGKGLSSRVNAAAVAGLDLRLRSC